MHHSTPSLNSTDASAPKETRDMGSKLPQQEETEEGKRLPGEFEQDQCLLTRNSITYHLRTDVHF
jgi:hypothetical protein